MQQQTILYAVPVCGALALLFAYVRSAWIRRQDAGTEEMAKISGYIRQGAMAFLTREYRVLAVFVVAVAALLAWANSGRPESSALVGVSLLAGAVCSGLAGLFGMRVATSANVRTAAAARTSLNDALQIAFSGGAVMGFCVVGLGVIGLGVLFIFYTSLFSGGDPQADLTRAVTVLTGFSFGASSIALFARVGGGIYTKAADVGADLVGKVEAGIPEDDPRNPATIADNVGDNVGDVAGMGADLFESYVGSIIGALVLGVSATHVGGESYTPMLAVLPLVLAAVGILVSLGGTFLVRTREGGDPGAALHRGTFGAALAMIVAIFFCCRWLLDGTYRIGSIEFGAINVFWATLAGLAGGVAIGLITEYYTSAEKKPTQEVARDSLTGSATNIIAGLALGMRSTALPAIVLVAAIIVAHDQAGLYGIAIAALGMLSTTGIQLAVDAYGPVADNAGGIAEMASCGAEVRERTDKLDAVGNTTAAIGKGFAIGSAALTALALFAAFRTTVGLGHDRRRRPERDGRPAARRHAAVPVLVDGHAGGRPGGLRDDRGGAPPVPRDPRPDGGQGRAGLRPLRRHLDPGGAQGDDAAGAAGGGRAGRGRLRTTSPLWAACSPASPSSGVMMAIFMANAGGAWDNAKKYIETGNHGGKGSDAHKAAVVGDTVGDPFKDTAGPSLNILIKLMSVVALVIAPLLI